MKYLVLLPLFWLAGCTTMHQAKVQQAEELRQADEHEVADYTSTLSNEQTDACADSASSCQTVLVELEEQDATDSDACTDCTAHFGISGEWTSSQINLLDVYAELAISPADEAMAINTRINALMAIGQDLPDELTFMGYGINFGISHRPNHWFAGVGGSFTDSCILAQDNRDHCLIAKRFAFHAQAGVQTHLFNGLRLQLYTRPTGVLLHQPIAPSGYAERTEALASAGSDWHFNTYVSWGVRFGYFIGP